MKILYLLIAALKFLGIAILILLLLLLLLVIIILTVPIKYRAYLNKSEEIYVDAKVSWLYSIVAMDIIYSSDEMITKFKLFGRVLGPRRPKKSKRKVVKDIDEVAYRVEEKSKEAFDKESLKEDLSEIKSEEIKTKKSKKSKKQKAKKTKKDSKGLKETFKQIQSFTYKRELVADSLNLIKRFLRRILPSTLYTEVEIGKEDPADTGQLIGKVSAFYPLYYSFATIIGNYEKECFYVKLDVSGQITLGKLIYEIIQYIRLKSVKQLIKFIRKDRKGKNHGRKTAK